MDSAWYITPDDLEAIEIGANVLGTGGGGNPYTVKLYARELCKAGEAYCRGGPSHAARRCPGGRGWGHGCPNGEY